MVNLRKGNLAIHEGKVYSKIYYQMEDGTVWGLELLHVGETHTVTEPIQVEWKKYWPEFKTLTAYQIGILVNNPSREWFKTTWKCINKV